MNDQMKRPPGKPSAMVPPPGVVISEKVEAAPGVRIDNVSSVRIEGAPSPIVDPNKSSRVEKPVKEAVDGEKEHTWHKVYIDLGPSTDRITINSQEFHHGQTATIRDDLLPVLNEVMYNTKMHEMVVKGQASPLGRRLQR